MNADTFVFLQFLRKILLPMPGVTEKPCFGTPAFYVNNKLFSRVREDDETIVVNTTERNKWMNADPDTFFITEHYRNYDCMLVNFKKVSPQDVTKLLVTAWYNRATKKLIKEYETQTTGN
jgi:hypothetical protein